MPQLFKHQEEYFDIPSQDLTARQVREKLAKLASEVLPANTVDHFRDLLTFKGSANGGNSVTDDLKYNSRNCILGVDALEADLSFCL